MYEQYRGRKIMFLRPTNINYPDESLSFPRGTFAELTGEVAISSGMDGAGQEIINAIAKATIFHQPTGKTYELDLPIHFFVLVPR